MYKTCFYFFLFMVFGFWDSKVCASDLKTQKEQIVFLEGETLRSSLVLGRVYTVSGNAVPIEDLFVFYEKVAQYQPKDQEDEELPFRNLRRAGSDLDTLSSKLAFDNPLPVLQAEILLDLKTNRALEKILEPTYAWPEFFLRHPVNGQIPMTWGEQGRERTGSLTLALEEYKRLLSTYQTTYTAFSAFLHTHRTRFGLSDPDFGCGEGDKRYYYRLNRAAFYFGQKRLNQALEAFDQSQILKGQILKSLADYNATTYSEKTEADLNRQLSNVVMDRLSLPRHAGLECKRDTVVTGTESLYQALNQTHIQSLVISGETTDVTTLFSNIRVSSSSYTPWYFEKTVSFSDADFSEITRNDFNRLGCIRNVNLINIDHLNPKALEGLDPYNVTHLHLKNVALEGNKRGDPLLSQGGEMAQALSGEGEKGELDWDGDLTEVLDGLKVLSHLFLENVSGVKRMTINGHVFKQQKEVDDFRRRYPPTFGDRANGDEWGRLKYEKEQADHTAYLKEKQNLLWKIKKLELYILNAPGMQNSSSPPSSQEKRVGEELESQLALAKEKLQHLNDNPKFYPTSYPILNFINTVEFINLPDLEEVILNTLSPHRVVIRNCPNLKVIDLSSGFQVGSEARVEIRKVPSLETLRLPDPERVPSSLRHMSREEILQYHARKYLKKELTPRNYWGEDPESLLKHAHWQLFNWPTDKDGNHVYSYTNEFLRIFPANEHSQYYLNKTDTQEAQKEKAYKMTEQILHFMFKEADDPERLKVDASRSMFRFYFDRYLTNEKGELEEYTGMHRDPGKYVREFEINGGEETLIKQSISPEKEVVKKILSSFAEKNFKITQSHPLF